jgi:hypothetical protein
MIRAQRYRHVKTARFRGAITVLDANYSSTMRSDGAFYDIHAFGC